MAVPGALASSDSSAKLARTLAPLLYIRRDEWFPLEGVVAVIHPSRPVMAYPSLAWLSLPDIWLGDPAVARSTHVDDVSVSGDPEFLLGAAHSTHLRGLP